MTPQPKTQIFDFSNKALYNESFIPLLQNKAEFLHMWGSAGSGKSRFEAQREIIKSFHPIRARRNTIVSRKVFATLKESCYAELLAVIYEWKLEDCFKCTTSPLHIENLVTGVGFIFRGFDNVEKIKSIVGADRAWYEEATESSGKQEILQLRNRLRGFKEVQVTLTYNPIDEHHWINEQIHNAENYAGHALHHSTYRDNQRMLEKDPNYEAFIEGTALTDPNYYRVYGLGLWGRIVGGLIYADTTVIPEFPIQADGEDAIHWYGLDFGYTNPTALVAQHVRDTQPSPENPSPKPRLINKEILYERGLDGPALVKRFDTLGVRKDRVIVADSAQPGMIRTLRDAGYNVRACEKFGGSVLVGINDVRKFQFEIVAGSKETIKEVRNYQKGKKNDQWIEEPAPGQVDHAMDAIRYAVQMAVKPKRKVKKVTSTSQSVFDGY